MNVSFLEQSDRVSYCPTRKNAFYHQSKTLVCQHLYHPCPYLNLQFFESGATLLCQEYSLLSLLPFRLQILPHPTCLTLIDGVPLNFALII